MAYMKCSVNGLYAYCMICGVCNVPCGVHEWGKLAEGCSYKGKVKSTLVNGSYHGVTRVWSWKNPEWSSSFGLTSWVSLSCFHCSLMLQFPYLWNGGNNLYYSSIIQ
jgi:hypothetical protein